uniref:Uncharacterized protein n=1 Tax=Nelumbo nucifera TaxID=4432 RepID=A0A822Y452_NELNU|nr:TPA_asm: hypothetical protein HUJ06_027293 [Nelumbo nucifera]
MSANLLSLWKIIGHSVIYIHSHSFLLCLLTRGKTKKKIKIKRLFHYKSSTLKETYTMMATKVLFYIPFFLVYKDFALIIHVDFTLRMNALTVHLSLSSMLI